MNDLTCIPKYLKALMSKLNDGEIDPMTFDTLTRSLHRLTDTMEIIDIDQRLQDLEARLAESA